MKRTKEYKFGIGDIVENKLILEQIRMSNAKATQKGYKYRCLKDNYIGEIAETKLQEGKGCPCCSGRVTIKGVNDVATTHPWMIEYFYNKEDCYVNSHGSNKNILFKCPCCGTTKTMKINALKIFGFACPRCGDGISFSEKFIFSFLCQLRVAFKTQYRGEWCKDKIYDFFLPNENIIIEAHGEQHYIDKRNRRGRSLKEEQLNDLVKEKLAIENLGCTYIQLDCRESSLEWIKNSIEKSEISNFFSFDKIDWSKCLKYASNNLVREVSESWDSGDKDLDLLCEKYQMCVDTIRKYLRQGEALGWCEYSKEIEGIKLAKIISKTSKRVYCFELNKVYESATVIEKVSVKEFGVHLDRRGVGKVCNGKSKTYKGFHFKYV